MNTHRPRLDVTVVMPSFNRSALITRALESVRQQTVMPHEILVVDDASTDDTVAQVEAWRERTGFPVRIEKLARNGGVAAARNRAMELATTRYISFLDSDDEHLPHTLAMLVTALEASPGAVVAFGDATKVTPEKTIPNAMFGAKIDILTIADPVPGEESGRFRLRNPKETFLKASLIATCSACFVRAEALAVGGMPVGYRMGSDWLFWLRLAQRGDFIFVQEDVSVVHRHPENLTKPGSAADTSMAKLAGYHAILDGRLGITVDPPQKRKVEQFIEKRIALLRYQSSVLGFTSYLDYMGRIPGQAKQNVVRRILADPKSTLRSIVSVFRGRQGPVAD
ncbi:glycosyltransferase family 2 protein [Massilia oculi]|uniref:Glycosyltransferase family 2 protein n=1 Tax=Massilia hydrophila TaxID=3044279 RepID=A0ABS7Y907_9BURK|nr:glycosyltransferase family A protein [Massilia oculi]MCA1855838.1 glycosyltransferase family 2 protein [Massilia oculi]